MDTTVLVVFAIVYFGMIIGHIPHLALDRTGIALLGAIALLATGHIGLDASWAAMDVSTLALLLGLMVVSAQFRLAGFYTRVIQGLAAVPVSPDVLLGLLVLVTGVLSALLANDVVCLAATPVLAQACARRRLDPVPFLLGLACASNVGSAATLIGNPQNMLIGQTLGLSFSGYLGDALVPSLLGLGAVWLVIRTLWKGRWDRETSIPDLDLPAFNRWQTTKGALVLGGLVVLFLWSPWPRGVLALAAAGILLTSRHMASRRTLALVDWQLLVLFGGLFIVNHVLAASGVLERLIAGVAGAGIDLHAPAWLFSTTVVLSNLVSNVPAIMLLLPLSAPESGALLALASTLAGNLFIVGSIANIIVVDQAATLGIRIGWKTHARVGVPVTLLTLALAALWLWVLA